MATKQQKIQALKKQFDDNAARKPKLAIETAVELERLEPGEPRWSHKRGELLQRQGNKEAAVEAYSLAVEKYAGRGFLPRAIAMAKIVLDLDPTRTWVMESLDQSEARQRHRESRVGIDLNDMLSDQKPLDRVAKVLAPAPSNGTDDLRFDDSAPVVLGMSRGELSTVIADAPREESDAGAMPAVPLFANAPQDAFERLVNGSQLAYADEGEIVLAPGDPSDSLYIIVEGEALVVSVEGDELAVLAEGDVFGESCLLPDGKRSATIKARDLLTTLRIPTSLLEEVIRDHGEVEVLVMDLLVRRLVSNTLRSGRVFRAVDEETRHAIANLFELRRVDPGTEIIQPGKRADGMYILVGGELVATGAYGDAEVVRAGRGFGEESLYGKDPSPVGLKATADTPAYVLRLPATQFKLQVVKNEENVHALQRIAVGLYDWT